MIRYKPLDRRTPDAQYKNTLRLILENGEAVQDTPQGVPAITYMAPPPMRFKVENGAPLLTERKISFWRKPIAEIIAFINGKRRLSELEEMGCGWWSAWATPEKCEMMGLEPGDLGPGSYGAAFHDFPMPDGKTFNQIAHVIDQIKRFPTIRTHKVSIWIPYYIGRGGHQKAVVAPCHGDLLFRILNGKMTMIMVQRSADVPIGVPSNMIQYFAILLMSAQVTGYEPYEYVHFLQDAHIYVNQIGAVKEILERESRPFPKLLIKPEAQRITDILNFRPEHFELEEYDPHPAIPNIPVAV